jgi:hypothetical protein
MLYLRGEDEDEGEGEGECKASLLSAVKIARKENEWKAK